MCQLHRLRLPVTEQQLHRKVGLPQASCCIDARCKPKGKVDRIELSSAHSCRLDERVNAHLLSLCDALQTSLDDQAVFSGQLHHVRHRCNGSQLAKMPDHLLAAKVALHRTDEFKGNTRAAQRFKGIFAVLPVRVDDRARLRQLWTRLMVVGDDKVDPQLFGVHRLVQRGNPVVHRDNQLHLLLL